MRLLRRLITTRRADIPKIIADVVGAIMREERRK